MTHFLMQDHDLLQCEDFSYTEDKWSGVCCFYDHAEGVSVLLSQQEFIDTIADSIAEEQEEDIEDYHRILAINIFANSTFTGRAKFLYGMLP